MGLLADDLVERVSKIIPRYSMLTPGDRVGVAVSGGADSVVLLHLLHRLVSKLAIHLTVLHINHGLRGTESDEDELFVQQLAVSLGLEFIGSRAAPAAGNLEQEARRVRCQFFEQCREQDRLNKIALGHTRSDQAETVLYRFLRGSGLGGLAGMRPITQDGLIRPLITTSRAEVRAWAAASRISWREDSSNLSDGFVRNRLRNRVIPALAAEFNPNLEGVLAGMAELAGAEEDYWSGVTLPLYEQLLKRTESGLCFEVGALVELHPAVRRRVIRHAVADVRGDLRSIDLQHIEAILTICQSEHGHDRVIIPGVDALRSFEILLLTRPGELNSGARNYSRELIAGQRLELPFGIGVIELRVLNSNHENCVNFKEDSQSLQFADLDFQALSGESTAFSFQIRNWRPGDELQRPGHQKPEKIKSLFQQYRVLLWNRRHWPVAVANEQIVWARGFGPASAYMATSESRSVARLYFWPGGDVREL